MTYTVEMQNAPDQLGEKEIVSKIGKKAVEAMKKSNDPRYLRLKEAIAKKNNVAVESIDVNDTDLFTTTMSSFVERRLRPKLVAAGLIKVISNFNSKGANAVKIPLRNALISGVDLPDDGTLTYDTGSYESTTVTLSFKYAAQRITHEILKFSNVDLIAEEMGEIGYALSKKIDSDIISALQTATTTGNSNLLKIGATATVSYANLVTGYTNALANEMEPTAMLLNPSTLGTIYQLDQFAGGNSITGAIAYKGGDTEAFPVVAKILGMDVYTSTQVDADDIFLIDSNRAGYLIQSSDGVQTFDGRISGALAYEIAGAVNYGVVINQPKAVYRIEENAA